MGFLSLPLELLPRHSTLLLTLGVCVATTSLSLYLLNRWKKTWTHASATVKSLIVYPIKSVAGVQVPSVTVSRNGFSYGSIEDRSMIVLSSEKRMITMRQEPRLSLVKLTLNEEETGFTLTAPGMDPLTLIPKQNRSSDDEIIKFTIWSTPTEGIDVGQGSSEWFSKFLGREARLVQYLPSFQKRPTFVETKKGSNIDPKIPIRYQDGSPVHLISESSITAANSLLPEQDTVEFDQRNFRANMIVGGSPAHQEEDWLYVRINEIVFKNVRLCTRCAIPTINQDLGVKVDSKAGVLKKFRSAKNEYETKNYTDESIFGINLAPESEGTVAVGMSVDVSFK